MGEINNQHLFLLDLSETVHLDLFQFDMISGGMQSNWF